MPDKPSAAATRPYKDRFGKTGTGISKPPPKKKKPKKKVKRSEALKKGPKAPVRTDTIRPDTAVHVVVKAPSFGPYTHSTKIGRVAESKTRMAKAKTQAKVKPIKKRRAKVSAARKTGRAERVSAVKTSSSRFDADPKIRSSIGTQREATGRAKVVRAKMQGRRERKAAIKEESSRFDAGPRIKKSIRKQRRKVKKARGIR